MNTVPLSEDAGDIDGAAVDGDQLTDQGQADARPFVRARRRLFDAVKSIEHAGEIVRRDADAGVPHAELDVASVAATATPIEPWNVNLKAFDSRLRTIFSHISRST